MCGVILLFFFWGGRVGGFGEERPMAGIDIINVLLMQNSDPEGGRSRGGSWSRLKSLYLLNTVKIWKIGLRTLSGGKNRIIHPLGKMYIWIHAWCSSVVIIFGQLIYCQVVMNLFVYRKYGFIIVNSWYQEM